MPLTRAISSLGCPDLTLDGVAALVARHGLQGCELRFLAGTVDLPGYFEATFGTPGALAAQVRSLGLTVFSLGTSFALIGRGEEDRREFLRYLPWAEALGIGRVRVFDGGKAGSDEELAEAAATCRWWQDVRRERGWKTDIMVETHDLLFTSAMIERFIAAVPGVPLLWDSHHTWQRGGENPLDTWAAVHAHVRHIHVKDSILQPSARHPFTYVLPGAGAFPAPALMARLASDGFAGPVSLEWERAWHPYLPSLDAALDRAAQGWWS
jgi:sugar phosphate isomerase/epimerase